MPKLPFPSNTNGPLVEGLKVKPNDEAPWKRTAPTEPPPLMFQIEFRDGKTISYAYADLRETRLRDAGFLQLCLLGMEKYHVNIEGRRLTELATLFNYGKLKSIVELGPRKFDRPEELPSIDSITIEVLTGP